MGEIKPNMLTKISTRELERRWKAVRTAMKEAKLDFLIMQNCTDFLGGYVKWFTDISPRENYTWTVIFPREDEMTTMRHGPAGTRDPGLPGIKKHIGVPILPTCCFGNAWEAEAVVNELAGYRNINIGLIGKGFISTAFNDYLISHLPSAKFSDASEIVDNIKAVKSDEEIEHIKQICTIQDECWAYALSVTKPGRKNFEVFADIMHKCMMTGSYQASLEFCSSPYGICPPRGTEKDDRFRVLQEGDQISMRIESLGASGYYAELIGVVVLGKICPELQEQFDIAVKAQQLSMDLCKPGASPMDIWEPYNAYLRSVKQPEEKRLLLHGQGYDMVERPSIQPGETMKIKAGLNIAAQATLQSPQAAAVICANYLVTDSGNIRLHKTPNKIFVV